MKHRYRLRLRPASSVTLPPGLAWEFVEMPPDIAHQRLDLPRSAHRFGVIATARPLTDEELERYDIDVHPNEPISATASAPQTAATSALNPRVRKPLRRTPHVRTPQERRLGKFLANARKASGLNQRALAKRMNVPHSWVGKNELAQRGVTVDDFIKWAHGVNTNAAELLGQFAAEELNAQTPSDATRVSSDGQE